MPKNKPHQASVWGMPDLQYTKENCETPPSKVFKKIFKVLPQTLKIFLLYSTTQNPSYKSL